MDSTPVPKPCVSVVMPVYNEAAAVSKVIDAVLRQPCVEELIVTDDCSKDGSWDLLSCLAAADQNFPPRSQPGEKDQLARRIPGALVHREI